MPIEVNAAALESVLKAAESTTADVRANLDDPYFTEKQRETLQLLDISIWVLRNALEKWWNPAIESYQYIRLNSSVTVNGVTGVVTKISLKEGVTLLCKDSRTVIVSFADIEKSIQ